MNTVTNKHPPTQAAADRFALKITARLSAGSDTLHYDIAERLRASRMQALSKRKKETAYAHVPASTVQGASGIATLGGGERLRWWAPLMSAIPLLALVVGLVMVDVAQDESNTNDVAEIDAALLTDDLPPAAYADPGFVQFLRTSAAAD